MGGSHDWAPFNLRDAERPAEAGRSSAQAMSLREKRVTDLDALLAAMDPPFPGEQ
ncbi:hypothetical protein OG948_54490 (plasmid) [Embleya sp. NBC_00888]|uniref:hypothetical protein n=1 Tax=Embleya sp. NBC_00888 TaxID=2975960 RepID=UPI002F91B2C6|nr:hypothetical protein OG948_54490 [Embleya sp. NBC_00888]